MVVLLATLKRNTSLQTMVSKLHFAIHVALFTIIKQDTQQSQLECAKLMLYKILLIQGYTPVDIL